MFSLERQVTSLPPTIGHLNSTAQPPQSLADQYSPHCRYTPTYKYDHTALRALHSSFPNVRAAPLPPVTAEPSACQAPLHTLALEHTQHNSDTLIITAKSSFSPNFHRAQLEEGVYEPMTERRAQAAPRAAPYELPHWWCTISKKIWVAQHLLRLVGVTAQCALGNASPRALAPPRSPSWGWGAAAGWQGPRPWPFPAAWQPGSHSWDS